MLAIAAACIPGVWTLARAIFAPKPVVHAAAILPDLKATPRPAPWTNAQRLALRRALDDAFAPALSDRYSLAVIDATGQVIYAVHARTAVTPASVQKLIVADTALHVLGPQYRFDTLLTANAPPDDGTIDGDLWLVGSGDPSLSSNDLRGGVAELDRAGVRRIDGAVAVDAAEMSGPEINPYWDPNDANEDFQVPTSAISIDDDTAQFRIYGGEPGAPARVTVVPASSDLHLSGEIRTSSDADDVVIAADAPNDFALSGSIPADAEEKFNLPVHDMPVYAGRVLQRMLRDVGVAIEQRPTTGEAPLASVALWDHRSAPLRALIAHMLYVSDNHYAEQFMRTLGIAAGGRGDDADGLAAERAFLRAQGIPTDGLHVVDGSGLAESDRVAAITLARILSRSNLYPLLPEGGRDGTLAHYDFTTALGRVRAKTGHLSDADSLAGYVTTMHHGRLAFAFMINDSPGDPDGSYVEAVDRLATF